MQVDKYIAVEAKFFEITRPNRLSSLLNGKVFAGYAKVLEDIQVGLARSEGVTNFIKNPVKEWNALSLEANLRQPKELVTAQSIARSAFAKFEKIVGDGFLVHVQHQREKANIPRMLWNIVLGHTKVENEANLCREIGAKEITWAGELRSKLLMHIEQQFTRHQEMAAKLNKLIEAAHTNCVAKIQAGLPVLAIAIAVIAAFKWVGKQQDGLA